MHRNTGSKENPVVKALFFRRKMFGKDLRLFVWEVRGGGGAVTAKVYDETIAHGPQANSP